ncbi:MAG: LysR substrate-binding domain-containing protein [Chromatiales bacterium]
MLNRDRLLDRLACNKDDLYIMGVPPEGLDTEGEPFMDNPLIVLAPASHPMVGRRRIPFAELAQETFLVREQGSGTRITMERLFQGHDTPLRIKMELGSYEAIKQAVAGGLGLTMLSRSTLNLDPSQRELAELDVEGFPIMRAWYVVRPKGKQLSVVADTFLEFMRDHVQLLIPLSASLSITILKYTGADSGAYRDEH